MILKTKKALKNVNPKLPTFTHAKKGDFSGIKKPGLDTMQLYEFS